jgi:hypothetical protein
MNFIWTSIKKPSLSQLDTANKYNIYGNEHILVLSCNVKISKTTKFYWKEQKQMNALFQLFLMVFFSVKDTCYTVVVSYRLYYMNHIPVNCYLDIRRIMQNIYILIPLLYNKRNDCMINNNWLQFRNTWVHPVFTCISDWHMLSTYMSLIFVFRVVMSALQHCSVRVYSHLICLGCMYLRKLVSNTMFISEEVVFVQQ